MVQDMEGDQRSEGYPRDYSRLIAGGNFNSLCGNYFLVHSLMSAFMEEGHKARNILNNAIRRSTGIIKPKGIILGLQAKHNMRLEDTST